MKISLTKYLDTKPNSVSHIYRKMIHRDTAKWGSKVPKRHKCNEVLGNLFAEQKYIQKY